MSKVLQERGSGSLPSSTKTNPRDHIKSISTTEEADIHLIRRIEPNQYAVSSQQKDDKIVEGIKEAASQFSKVCYKLEEIAEVKDKTRLVKLAPTKLIIKLADKTMKRPKGIAENVLVRINKFFFPVDFIVLDMPEDIKIPLILGRPFLCTPHAKINVFKRNFSLRVGNDKIVFKSDSPTSKIIKKVYVLGLRERKSRLMGEALILNRLQDPKFVDFLELNDLNEPLELRNHKNEDLDPEIEEGEVIDELMIDVVEIRHDNGIIEKIDEYPSFTVMANMGAYRDKDMGDVIFGKPVFRDECVEARRIQPLLKVSARDKLEGNSHSYQKLKGFNTAYSTQWIRRIDGTV
ncbi:DNA/RNA polymerases superfamily protein [Tanacetum coccineum]